MLLGNIRSYYSLIFNVPLTHEANAIDGCEKRYHWLEGIHRNLFFFLTELIM